MKLRIFLTMVMVALTGCATAKFDADKTHAVKKLAILAIEIQQQQPKDALGIKKMADLEHRIGDTPELQGMAKDIMGDLADQIEKKTGWQVLTLAEMKANPAYSAKVKSVMEGLRNTSIVSQNYELVSLHGTLDAAAFKNMNQEQRAALARSLGADAFALVQIYLQIDQGWSIGNLSGDAAFTFYARSNMDVYGLNSDEPIWRTQNVDGPETVRSDSLEGLPVRERLSKLGKDAVDTSFSKLVSTYK